MRHGDFTVLVATLLGVRYLILKLDAASTRFDHLLGQQVGGFFVTETGIDVGNNRHNVSFVIVDLGLNVSFSSGIASFTGGVEFAEQTAQLAGISLAQEGVKLFNQRRNRRFFVHRLIGQWAEVRAQRGNHPARQVEVALVSRLKVLLDGDHFLLADKAVPAAQ